MYFVNGKLCANGFEAISLLGMSDKTLKNWIKKKVEDKLFEAPPSAAFGTKKVPCYPAEYLGRVIVSMGLPRQQIRENINNNRKLDGMFRQELLDAIRDKE